MAAEVMDFQRQFAMAYGGPAIEARFKSVFEDFIVEEELGFSPSGEGEHLYLYIEKKDQNTGFLQQRLADYFSIPVKSVSYCGLKDRHAVTRQWFGVHLPGKLNDQVAALNDDTTQVLSSARHNRKLRIGAHRHNRFIIRLRDVTGDRAIVEGQLQRIAREGVPNYFGAQRFGRERANLQTACDLFAGRKLKKKLRSLAISSARSYLYNCVLDERVRQGSWASWQPGDVVSLAGSNSFFIPELMDEVLEERLLTHDVHLSAPLWGRGKLPSSDLTAELERVVVDQYPALTEGLEAIGLDQQRRAMRMSAQQLSWQFEGDDLVVQFNLASGCYATSLLRELVVADKPL
ncbi:tRNA pseudouridine13 synthase [Sinobacterium caligoides]|uniref:tRNA pseudouridine synthase D n=1 Tax=Sinobacterium caligoides TaxID=933926 RepID=A0A3N2DMJ4_9GAMM|nr:tRNA pseudouridine(13) synthase TruD [Sinobacterium caligoides]ROS01024.1 tRNA pseudouridine13 synthase [Sinobacterium caligoides]